MQFCFLVLVALFSGCASNFKAVSPRLPIFRSYSAPSTELLAIQLEPGAAVQQYQFFIGSKEGQSRVVRQDVDGLLIHVEFNQIGKEQDLVIQKGGVIIDRRELVPIGSKIAVASCMSDADLKMQEKMWKGLSSKLPQLLFFIGDNVYADFEDGNWTKSTTPNQLVRRHHQTRARLQIFKEFKLPRMVAVWDDHDFGANDGDGTYSFKEQSRSIFNQFFPINAVSQLSEIGTSKALVVNGVQFLFIDNRYYRKNGVTHWGEQQYQRIKKSVQSFAGPSVLIQGDQFFGGYHRFESFEGNNPDEFTKFKSDLKKAKYPILFLSGDRHLSEVMRIQAADIGQDTVEITSSPIHAKVFPSPWRTNPNPRQIIGLASKENYLILNLVAEKRLLSLEADFYGIDGPAIKTFKDVLKGQLR